MRISAKDPYLISLLGDFIKVYLPCIRNRDDDTIASYRHSINLFMSYLNSVRGLSLLTIQASDFNQKDIVAYMNWLAAERHNVATTINHRLSDIRGFCQYLLKKKAISPEVYEGIREINDVADERIADFTWLSVNDMTLILQSVLENRDAKRDYFLLSLLYESGARINEVLSLKLLDLKPTSDGEVDAHFYGKGNKHRITPLSKEIWLQFGKYCELYHPERNPDDLLFYSYRNGRRNKMSSDNVSRILADSEFAVKQMKPDLIHLHSHLFRRTRAMHLYQAGVPLPTISDWLGHSSIETTRFYYGKQVFMESKIPRRLKNNRLQ